MHPKDFCLRVTQILYSDIKFSDSGKWTSLSQTKERHGVWLGNKPVTTV
jgi:hypothetical protein